MTQEVDLAAYLTSKGVKFYRGGGSELQMHCLFGCGGSAVRGRGKLYANVESWLYTCFVCQVSGNRKTLLEHFGDEDEVHYAVSADPMLRRRLLTEAADLAHEMLIANEKQLDYLLERGIDLDLVIKHRLGYVPRNFDLAASLPSRDSFKGYEPLITAGLVTIAGRPFFDGSLVIPYFSHGQVIQLRARDIDKKYRTAGGDVVRLFNADALFGADEVLITEGEFDALRVMSVFLESGQRAFPTNVAVVAIPGTGAWPDGLIEMLSGASRVFIGLDADDAGRKGAAKLKDEIGTKARVVNIPEEGEDWTDWLRTRDWKAARDLLVEADLAGKQMFSVVDLATKWTKRQSESPGLKLGWPSLDSVLRPGLKPGQLMIPLATTGTGKTVVLSNITYNLRESRVLFVSLEMTGAEVYEHLQRIHRFWSADDDIEPTLARLRVTERNRIGRGDLEELIEQYREEVGFYPDVVIVDYLQYYARGFRGHASAYERVGDAIMELKAVAKDKSVSVIAPSQVNRGASKGKPLQLDDARDAGTIEETGDFVISLFRPDQIQMEDGTMPPETGVFKTQILKSRHGNVGRVSDLRFSNLSLVIVDAIFDRTSLARVEAENKGYRLGLTYDDYLFQTAQRALAL